MFGPCPRVTKHGTVQIGLPVVSFFGRSVAGFFDTSDFVSLDSSLLCHWNHLGFFIVRLTQRLSVQPAE
jgi:hypothetical protein